MELKPNRVHQVEAKTPDDALRIIASDMAAPAFAASRVMVSAEGREGLGAELDLGHLLACLREQADAVNSGDLKHPEAMLINQATALQTLFVRLTEKALGSQSLEHFEIMMRMALRAQSQSRASIETLSTLKNPPVYAAQANIAHGHQQVNNDLRAGEKEILQNQLSGEVNELLPDARAPSIESRTDPTLETVGAVHRTKDRGR